MTSFKDFSSKHVFYKYADKEFLVNIPDDLLNAIDSPAFRYYILQGSWGVGKSCKLMLLKGLLELYISENKIEDLIVLYIKDANESSTNELLDQLESYFPGTNLAPSRLMHKVLSLANYRKIVLVDMWSIKNKGRNAQKELYRFTRPIDNHLSYKNKKITQIVAGSGSWSFNSLNEDYVTRYLYADNMSDSKIWKIVEIKPLDSETVQAYIKRHLLDESTIDTEYLLKLTGGIFYFVDLYIKLVKSGTDDVDRVYSCHVSGITSRKLGRDETL